MNKKLLFLSAAALLGLVSCGGVARHSDQTQSQPATEASSNLASEDKKQSEDKSNPAESLDPVAGSEGVSESEGVIDSEHEGEESSAGQADESLPDESGDPSNQSSVSSGEEEEESSWPEAVAEIFDTYFEGCYLPYFDFDWDTFGYSFDDYTEEYGCYTVTLYDEGGVDTITDVYGDLLIDAGFEPDDPEAEETSYSITLIDELENEIGLISVSFYFDDYGDYTPGNAISASFYLPGEQHEEFDGKQWPSDLVGAMEETLGIVLPLAPLDTVSFDWDTWPEDDENYAGLEIWDFGSENVVEAYAESLLEEGFKIGYDTEFGEIFYFLPIDPEEDEGYIHVSLDFDSTGELYNNYIYAGYYYDLPVPVEFDPSDIPTPVEGSEISFANEDFITSKGLAKTVWGVDDVTFTVEKGSSQVNVGNKDYYSNPLRLYTGQTCTVAWGEDPVTAFSVLLNKSQKDSNFDLLVESSSLVGATVSHVPGGDLYTFTVKENANKVSWSLAGQARLDFAAFAVAEVE